MAHTTKTVGRKEYIVKSLKWYIFNMICGCLPLIALFIACKWSPENIPGKMAFDALYYHEAIILIVSCTLMCSIIIDFHLGGYWIRGNALLAMYGVPFVNVVLLLLKYIFNKFNLSHGELFNLKSIFILSILGISIVYCIGAKFYLYLREENEEREALGINLNS